ncbi:hypothetical protein RFI_17374, partial [Reticulomyxa filosa]
CLLKKQNVCTALLLKSIYVFIYLFIYMYFHYYYYYYIMQDVTAVLRRSFSFQEIDANRSLEEVCENVQSQIDRQTNNKNAVHNNLNTFPRRNARGEKGSDSGLNMQGMQRLGMNMKSNMHMSDMDVGMTGRGPLSMQSHNQIPLSMMTNMGDRMGYFSSNSKAPLSIQQQGLLQQLQQQQQQQQHQQQQHQQHQQQQHQQHQQQQQQLQLQQHRQMYYDSSSFRPVDNLSMTFSTMGLRTNTNVPSVTGNSSSHSSGPSTHGMTMASGGSMNSIVTSGTNAPMSTISNVPMALHMTPTTISAAGSATTTPIGTSNFGGYYMVNGFQTPYGQSAITPFAPSPTIGLSPNFGPMRGLKHQPNEFATKYKFDMDTVKTVIYSCHNEE